MISEFRKFMGGALTPLARAWIRYSPIAFGKSWLWETFHWRHRAFTCRTRFGAIVTGSTEDLIQRHLYYFGIWEPNISNWIGATLRDGDGFVDVGANIGYYSLLAGSIVGTTGNVVAIEAAPSIYSMLEKHIQLNGRSNIRTVQAAASAMRGVIKLFLGSPDNIGKTTTINCSGASIDVPALPLSEILDHHEIRRARILKIDVEGAELHVLRGMVPLFGRLREDLEIVMEISPSLMPYPVESAEEIFSIMRVNGFGAFVFENDYGVDTYLKRSSVKRPQRMTNFHFTSQADVLFSKSAS